MKRDWPYTLLSLFVYASMVFLIVVMILAPPVSR